MPFQSLNNISKPNCVQLLQTKMMNHPPQSTGIFIPLDKKGLFIVAFEKILLDRHNIITTFKETKNGSSCEVKFMMKQSQKLNTMRWNCINAKVCNILLYQII